MGAANAPKTGGRRKGTPNKRTRELVAILDEHGYCPIADAIWVAAVAKKEYERSGEIYDAIQDERTKQDVRTPLVDTAPDYLRIVQTSALGIAPYAFPKRKSIEFDGANAKDFITAFGELAKAALLKKDGSQPS